VAEGQTLEIPVKMTRAGAVLVDVTRNSRREAPSDMATEGGESRIFWSKQTNAEGVCIFEGLPPGENRIRVAFAKDESDRTNQVALAVDGDCGFDLDVSFPKGGAVRVWLDPADALVVDDHGKDENRKSGRWRKWPRRFAFENLPPGEYRLGLQHFKSAKEMNVPAPWKAEQTKTIRLEPGQRPMVAVEF
jgi:hypothetical protein